MQFFLIIIFLILAFTAFTGAPYVPSRKPHLEIAFTKLYPLSSADTLIDLGAGDGTVLKAAAKHGASSVGVELNPAIAFIAWLRTRRVKNLTKIICRSYYSYHFPPETTVVYVFGDSRDILKIYTKVVSEAVRLKKPLHFISLAFPVPGQTLIKTAGPYYLYKIQPKP